MARDTGWGEGPGWDEPATGTSSTSWDLDAGPDPATAGGGTGGGGFVALLAVALAGLGIGGLTGSSLAPDPAPHFPPAATLGVEETHIDVVGASGPGGQRSGEAVVSFRLEVTNPGPDEIRVTAVVVDGVSRRRTRVPLSLRLPGNTSAGADLTLHADCSTDRQPVAVRARLLLTGAPDTGGGTAVVPSIPLEREGGLCTLVDSQSPPGWRTPLQARSSRVEGKDLVVVTDDLSGLKLGGILVDGQLLPTVFVGDQLLSTSARVRPGERTLLRLTGPPPCVTFSGPAPIPSTLRILAQNQGSLEQRLVVVGPELTRWLALGC